VVHANEPKLVDNNESKEDEQASCYSSTTETHLHETEKTMHAALVNLTIAPDQAPAAANVLTHDILPAIRSAPGFVAGYWLEPVNGHGFSFVVFETEEQARRSAPRRATGQPPASPSTMSTSGEWLPALRDRSE
jgi:hypothetical protein